MIKKIEVWFDKYNKYWNVSTYNEENHQYDERPVVIPGIGSLG